MRKIITIATMIFSLLIGTAYAEFFYNSEQSGLWTAVGIIGDEKNPRCLSFMEYEDGSSVEVVKDMKDGELYIIIYNTDWNITDEPGVTGNGQMRFIKGNNITATNDIELLLVNKNTVAIPNIYDDIFIPQFMKNDSMRLIMPGTTSNISIPLTGTMGVVEKMIECFYAFKDVGTDNKVNAPGKDA